MFGNIDTTLEKSSRICLSQHSGQQESEKCLDKLKSGNLGSYAFLINLLNSPINEFRYHYGQERELHDEHK